MSKTDDDLLKDMAKQMMGSMDAAMNEAVMDNLSARAKLEPTIRQTQAGMGSLKLPELLDMRRVEYAIPDGAFTEQAAFDRVFLYQVLLEDGEKYGDTKIIRPSAYVQATKEAVPYGIVVSAGLPAMDTLRANGIELGHIVGFIQQAPFRKEVANINGISCYVILIRAGDITGSVDLAKAQKEGKCQVKYREFESDDGVITREHIWVNNKGETWNPSVPYISPSY